MEQLIFKYDKRPIRGDLYTLPNLKVLLDDLLNEYLGTVGHKRSFIFTDLRNACGIASIVFAAVIVWISMSCDFTASRMWLGITIGGYALMYLLDYVCAHFEGGKFYYTDFTIITRADITPVYILLLYRDSNPVPYKYTKSILDLFDDTGRLDHDLFIRDMENIFVKK